MKHTSLKIFIGTALFAVLISISGCQVKPDETINSFFEAVANKDLNKASTFCTKSFRDKFTNLPSAFKNYNYSIKSINWELKDLYVKPNGLIAKTYVSVKRDWPLPAIVKAIFTIDLSKENGKWYISDVQSTIPEYIDFTSDPQDDDKYYLFTLVRPRWLVEKQINEPLTSFVKQYDECCYSWLH